MNTTKSDIGICSHCHTGPNSCLPWCLRAVRGESIPWLHNPFDPRVRDQIDAAKRRSATITEVHKGAGGD